MDLGNHASMPMAGSLPETQKILVLVAWGMCTYQSNTYHGKYYLYQQAKVPAIHDKMIKKLNSQLYYE